MINNVFEVIALSFAGPRLLEGRAVTIAKRTDFVRAWV